MKYTMLINRTVRSESYAAGSEHAADDAVGRAILRGFLRARAARLQGVEHSQPASEAQILTAVPEMPHESRLKETPELEPKPKAPSKRARKAKKE